MSLGRTSRVRSGSPARAAAASATMGAQPAALADLKHRVLWLLMKLSDRDTQRFAVDDLAGVVQRLTPEGLNVFLTCLYDTDQQQKAYARKETVRLFGTVAAMHGEVAAPHLPKIMLNLVRRFRDPDSGVREACAEAAGMISAHLSPAGSGGMAVLFRPLFDALNEQNRSVQSTASLCLAKVIEQCSLPLETNVPRICPRMTKCIATPSFMGKPGMLQAVGHLSKATGKAMLPQLPAVIPAVLEALGSDDWMTRKAATEALTEIAASQDKAALAEYKDSVTSQLENCRFDKVKPVRASIADTLQAWKEVASPKRATALPPASAAWSRRKSLTSRPTSPLSAPLTPSKDAADVGDDVSEAPSTPAAGAPPAAKGPSTPRVRTPLAALRAATQRRAQSARAASPTKARTSAATKDKKRLSFSQLRNMNPTFFGSSPTAAPADTWTVQVAVPRKPPPERLPSPPPQADPPPNQGGDMAAEDCNMEKEALERHLEVPMGEDLDDVPWASTLEEDPPGGDEEEGVTEGRSNVVSKWEEEDADVLVVSTPVSKWDRPQSAMSGGRREDSIRGPGSGDGPEGSLEDHSVSESVLRVLERAPLEEGETPKEGERSGDSGLRGHLERLEQQQARLSQMLQELITGNQAVIDGVDARVAALERTVEALCARHGLQLVPAGSETLVLHSPHPPSGNDLAPHPSSAYRTEEPPVRTKYPGLHVQLSSPDQAEANRSLPAGSSLVAPPGGFQERVSGNGYGSPVLSEGDGGWRSRSRGGGESGDWATGSQQYTTSPHGGAQLPFRPAYPPEDTFGPPPGRLESQGFSRRPGLDSSVDLRQSIELLPGGGSRYRRLSEEFSEVKERRRSTGGGELRIARSVAFGDGQIRSAKAWSSALEWLRQGRVEEAYMEVLALGDELQLVRLIGRTGPVLVHLSADTAAEVFSALVILVRQESFLDIIMPWFYQVADMRRDLLPRSLQRIVIDALQYSAQQPTLAGSESAQIVTKLCALWASY